MARGGKGDGGERARARPPARAKHNYPGRAITRSIGFNFRFTFRRITQEISAPAPPPPPPPSPLPPCTSGTMGIRYLSGIILANITRIGITALHGFYCPALKLALSPRGGGAAAGLSSSCTLNPVFSETQAGAASTTTTPPFPPRQADIGSGPAEPGPPIPLGRDIRRQDGGRREERGAGRLSRIPQRIKPHKFHGALRGIIGMRPYVRLSAPPFTDDSRQTRAISMRLYASHSSASHLPTPPPAIPPPRIADFFSPSPTIPADVRSGIICVTARGGWMRIRVPTGSHSPVNAPRSTSACGCGASGTTRSPAPAESPLVRFVVRRANTCAKLSNTPPRHPSGTSTLALSSTREMKETRSPKRTRAIYGREAFSAYLSESKSIRAFGQLAKTFHNK